MALLHRLRLGGRRLTAEARPLDGGWARSFLVAAALGTLAVVPSACDRGVPPELQPDEVLRTELALGEDDEVHTVVLTGGASERAEPSETEVQPGAWVQFVSGDFRLHQVRFAVGEMESEAVAFLTGSDQVDSPPLLDRGARFVVSFEGAPPGRYPFLLEGETAGGGGVVVVRAPG